MKNIILLFIACFFYCCQPAEKSTRIELTNSSSIALKEKPVAIQRSLIDANIEEGFLKITNADNETIPYQLDDLDGDGDWDQLFFVADFAPGEKVQYSLDWVETAPTFPKRTSVRLGVRNAIDAPVEEALEETLEANGINWAIGFQKYQTDGPMWENDKIGFRHYLDGRNSKDIFGKKIAAISPETVGLDSSRAVVDNYHTMEDWGRDILSVGNSVGIGGYGLLVGDELMRLGILAGDTLNNVATTTFKIITEGPVLSQMTYEYKGWKPKEQSYNVRETVRIWPGMYAFESTVQLENLEGDESLVVGLVNTNTKDSLIVHRANDTYTVLYTYDYQTYEKEWKLGLGLIVPTKSFVGYLQAPKEGRITGTYLAKLQIVDNKPITYYAVAGWELSPDDFKSEDKFKNYIVNLADQLAAEVTIQIIK